MPKKQNLSHEHLSGLVQRADDLAMDLIDAANEIRAGRIDEILEPTEAARKFARLASEAADMAALVLMQAKRDELDRELKSLRQDVA